MGCTLGNFAIAKPPPSPCYQWLDQTQEQFLLASDHSSVGTLRDHTYYVIIQYTIIGQQ
jgi:hypothetical protein